MEGKIAREGKASIGIPEGTLSWPADKSRAVVGSVVQIGFLLYKVKSIETHPEMQAWERVTFVGLAEDGQEIEGAETVRARPKA